MNSTHPLVSVIIPVFNAKSFLAACIESVLQQTYSPIEIIAVEDGSNEHQDIIKNFPSVHYITQPKSGAAAARNLGIQQSKGLYISFLDCDDIFLPEKTKLQVDYLENHPDSAAVAGLIEEFLEPGISLPSWVREGALAGPHKGISPGCLMVRKSTFTRLGLFDTSLTIGSDTEWILRAKKQSVPVDYILETVLMKRIHTSNQSSHSSPEAIVQYKKELLQIFRSTI